MTKQPILTFLGVMALSAWTGNADAQGENQRTAHAAMYLQPVTGTTTIPFDWNDAGKEFRIRWGLDTAWDDVSNVRRGTNFIGKENMATGRISFQPSDLVDADGNLSAAQKQALDSRIAHIKRSGVTTVAINCDHEALNASNYKGKPEQWYKVIKASVKYAQSKGLTVESIAPFNEPDYTAWNEGSKLDFLNICKKIRADKELDGIRLCGGNTLNCDQALSWYNYLKTYLDEGNTHQLAGSFDNYAGFFQKVKQDGKVATADELHNVGEAIVGIEYGMENGIWWGFDGVARGEFCKANMEGGARLAYAENRESWTSAAVYRLPDGKVDGFLGSSERQATTHTYDFVSKGRDVYYDGYGPMRCFSVTMPGGTGYQQGQTNAERMVRITQGEDVAPYPITKGEYVIVNRYSGKALQASGNPVPAGTTLTQGTVYKNAPSFQRWLIDPVKETIGGDFSYFTLRCSNNPEMYADLLNWSLEEGDGLVAYNGTVGANEQWILEYAGNGDYYIRSRHSGLYLQSNNTTDGTKITQAALKAKGNQQRWRILPSDVKYDASAPKATQGLTATAQTASVLLNWDANTETDLDSYRVLRALADEAEPQWQVIGRQVKETAFVDNSCEMGAKYIYKVQAMDHACNFSKATKTVPEVTATVELPKKDVLVAWYDMENSLYDTTENQMDAVVSGTVSYDESAKKLGKQSLVLNGTNTFLQVPATVAGMEEMTIATWVNWKNTSSNWTRIFDFGNGTDEYMFLTPSNGSQMRFVIKMDGAEQILSASKLTSGWHHVAVTLGADGVVLYVDGKAVGTSQMSARPSMISPSRCYIGRSQFAADPLFKGNIDDFRIYSFALSAEDIALVAGGNQPTGIAAPQAPVAEEVKKTEIYSLDGVQLPALQEGINIVKEIGADGTVKVRKVRK